MRSERLAAVAQHEVSVSASKAIAYTSLPRSLGRNVKERRGTTVHCISICALAEKAGGHAKEGPHWKQSIQRERAGDAHVHKNSNQHLSHSNYLDLALRQKYTGFACPAVPFVSPTHSRWTLSLSLSTYQGGLTPPSVSATLLVYIAYFLNSQPGICRTPTDRPSSSLAQVICARLGLA